MKKHKTGTNSGQKKGSPREWLSIFMVKYPKRFILIAILLMNIVLWILSALLISALSPESLEHASFFESIFYTISMILDAGCIQYVVADIGEASVLLIIICLITILLGMISFTGAVIGYVTNYISDFINNSKTGQRALYVTEHTVILNWNTRASEIINDMLYSGRKETIVVLVPARAEEIQKEISERLTMTIRKENLKTVKTRDGRVRYKKTNRLKNRLTIIVREGDTYSTKQLQDISIQQAKSIIILGRDTQNSGCRYEAVERAESGSKGNSYTVKTLIQVAELTGRLDSADNQVVIVEIDDPWTGRIVYRIIEQKEQSGKSKIVPVPVNNILGQLLSQFSIMPELNFVYGELFSNKGASFFCRTADDDCGTEETFVRKYLPCCTTAIPLTVMEENKEGRQSFFVAAKMDDCSYTPSLTVPQPIETEYNTEFRLERRNVVIVGHNSNSMEIMEGFNSFVSEWSENAGAGGLDMLKIIVIDDKKNLEKRDYFKAYPYVVNCVEADIFDGETIKEAISDFVDGNEQDTSVLILSDDMAAADDIDANALTYLIYVQEVIAAHIAANPDFDRGRIDVVVEIINPKNEDVVRSYSVDNVVISNKYISKVITQLGIKVPLYEFYKDILTYDEDGEESKELYIKEVGRFLTSVPEPCTAYQLIRSVYEATPEDNKAVVLGYIRPHPLGIHSEKEPITLFCGDLTRIRVELQETDKLIIFSNH